MNKWNVVVLSVLLMGSLIGCGKAGENDPALQANLSGKVAGQAWALKFGTTRFNNVTKNWVVALYNIDHQGDPCTAKYNPLEPIYLASFAIGELKAMELDAKTDSVSLSKIQQSGSTSTSVTVGAFGVARTTKVENDVVEGQLDVKGDDSNYLKGKFTATVCR